MLHVLGKFIKIKANCMCVWHENDRKSENFARCGPKSFRRQLSQCANNKKTPSASVNIHVHASAVGGRNESGGEVETKPLVCINQIWNILIRNAHRTTATAPQQRKRHTCANILPGIQFTALPMATQWQTHERRWFRFFFALAPRRVCRCIFVRATRFVLLQASTRGCRERERARSQ